MHVSIHGIGLFPCFTGAKALGQCSGRLTFRPPCTSFWDLILHKEIICMFNLIVTVSRLYIVFSSHKAVVGKMGQELATHPPLCIPNLW